MATGCTYLDPNHCNVAGAEVCEAPLVCSRCTPQNNGCVMPAELSSDCLVGASASDGTGDPTSMATEDVTDATETGPTVTSDGTETSPTGDPTEGPTETTADPSTTQDPNTTEDPTDPTDTDTTDATDTDATDTMGMEPYCGDGIVDPGEECDCGDPIECPDPNGVPENRTCYECLFDRYVYLSNPTTPEFVGSSLNPDIPGDGIDAWDLECLKALNGPAHPQIHGSPRPIYAWLSTSGDDPISPANRFFHHQGRYVMPRFDEPDLVIAYGWEGLTAGALLNPIDRTPNGEEPFNGSHAIWSNTKDDGTSLQGLDCDNWITVNNPESGAIGNRFNVDKWTNDSNVHPCSNAPGHVYCFEQATPEEL